MSPASELESAHSRCSCGNNVVYVAAPFMLKTSATHMMNVNFTADGAFDMSMLDPC
jgi:hypothetical protein